MYSSIVDYYDDIFPFRQEQGDFVVRQIKAFPDTHFLDVGCGTGILVWWLSYLFFEGKLEAIDLNSDMIDKAKSEFPGERHQIQFRPMDMRHIDTHFEPKFFEGISCFGNTLVHLTEYNERLKFLRDCKKLLAPKGKLMLQILNYEMILEKQLTELPLIENDKIVFKREYEFLPDQRILFKTHLTVKETGQNISNTTELYALTKQELTDTLTKAGFSSLVWYSDFSRTAYDKDKLPLIVAAE